MSTEEIRNMFNEEHTMSQAPILHLAGDNAPESFDHRVATPYCDWTGYD